MRTKEGRVEINAVYCFSIDHMKIDKIIQLTRNVREYLKEVRNMLTLNEALTLMISFASLVLVIDRKKRS